MLLRNRREFITGAAACAAYAALGRGVDSTRIGFRKENYPLCKVGSVMPYDYKVQYINPNGSTLAYVDIDVVLDIDTEVELYGQVVDPAANWNIFYWTRPLDHGEIYKRSSLCVIQKTSKGRFAKVNTSSTGDLINIPYDPNSFTFKTSGRNFYVNGEQFTFGNPNGTSSVMKTLLFVLNEGTGVNSIVTDAGTRISKMKITKNGTVIRDMYAVVANNKPTMYDEVTGMNMPTYGQILAGPRL